MLDAVARFLLEYAPKQTEDHLYRGYQNRMALPQEADYTVFDIYGTQRVGTNVRRFGQTADVYHSLVLREYTIQIDFFSRDNELAALRANTIETLGNNYVGVDFFKQYGITLTYCEDVQYLPFTDLTEQYIYRYRITLHLTRWEKVTTVQDYADEVVITRLENIYGHHPR